LSLVVALVFVPTSFSFAQSVEETRSSVTHRIEGSAPRIDAVLDDKVWDEVPPLQDWYQQRPEEGAPPSEKTSMRLAYDEEALYLGVRADEEDPDAVTVRTLERDSYNLQEPEQDAVGIVLDAFNDQRTALSFIVTPAGVRTDVEIASDGRQVNPNWDTFWQAETRRTADGWVAEMRVPFASLRFDREKRGTVEMGLILWRYLARNAEYNVYPEISNNWASSAYKPSQAKPVTFQGVKAARPFYVKPYALAGLEREERLNAAEDQYRAHRRWRRKGGLDVKHNLTSDLILDLTLNTDFAQVETDDQRINLSRFSLFFPEKRDFFQERSGLFTYRFPGGPERLFQSRRIGIYEGQPVPILGGARLTGQVKDWEIGVIEMQTDEMTVRNGEVPSENFGVLRFKRPAGSRGSYVGGMVTSRSDLKEDHNVVVGADNDLHLWGDYFFGAQLAHTFEPGAEPARSTLGSLLIQRRVRRGWSFGSSFRHTGSDFNPRVGFLRRAGMNRWGHRTQYTWFPGEGHAIQNHSLAHRFEFIWGSAFNRLETSTSSLTWNFLFRSSATARLRAKFSHEQLREGFAVGGGELAVEDGTYRFVEGEASFTSRDGVPLQVEAELRGGEYFRGYRYGTTFSSDWTASPHFSLQLDYVLDRIVFSEETFTGHVGRFRVRAALNPTLSASAFLQYNSSERLFTPHLRVRYNPREGNNLYVVFREGRRTGPESVPSGPDLLRVPQRTILVKYSHTFSL
jgi:hypothetical protein